MRVRCPAVINNFECDNSQARLNNDSLHLSCSPRTCCTRSRMYSYAKLDFLVRTMTNLETGYFAEKTECHIANFDDMSTIVRFWQTADHHVRIADRFHLCYYKITIRRRINNATFAY